MAKECNEAQKIIDCCTGCINKSICKYVKDISRIYTDLCIEAGDLPEPLYLKLVCDKHVSGSQYPNHVNYRGTEESR